MLTYTRGGAMDPYRMDSSNAPLALYAPLAPRPEGLCRRTAALLILAAATLLTAYPARAQTGQDQTATISGFVTDRTDGQSLEGATVVLDAADGEPEGVPDYGTATDSDGLYLIRSITPGQYVLQVSFVGYSTFRDTLALAGGEVRTTNVALEPAPKILQEVLVQTEREHGMARVTAGHQTIRPGEIELVPSPDVSADLASYLTTLPGIVTTGDRGGQLFIRGGEPSQNLVLLDGMIVYQPFHILGFYSAFPADILHQTNLYAGGFGSRYAGRLSSVIDVTTRSGNNRRFAGGASVSPLAGAVRLEGPLIPNRLSFLASARESLLEHGAERMVRDDLPFRFGDAFAKVQGTISKTSRISLIALRTHDRGSLGNEIGGTSPEEISWTNRGFGARVLLLPRFLPVSLDLNLSHSGHSMEMGPRDRPVRSSSIRSTRIALDATFFGERVNTDAGWEVIGVDADFDLGGLFQNTFVGGSGRTTLGLYVEPEVHLDGGLQLRPGIRLQFYNDRFDPYLEPRLRAVWEHGIHQVSGAVGLYHQGIVGLSDRRDAASVFTVWTGIQRKAPAFYTHLPREQYDDLAGRIGRAFHAILGYRFSPGESVECSVEGFYKSLSNLFVGQLTALPRLTTRLQPATGRSMGFEARAELRLNPVYAYVSYGLSSTVYEAEDAAIERSYGLERLRYRPPHDRRHQVNALLSSFVRGFEFSVRWEFGSGFPYTRPIGFDGFALVDGVRSAFDLGRSRRAIYERPFGAVLPTYHRLDLSVERTWRLSGVALTLQGSAINVYDRRNLFYVDVFTMRRTDQLPFVPSLGLKVSVE